MTKMIVKPGKVFHGRNAKGHVHTYVAGDIVELSETQVEAFGDVFDIAPNPTPAEAPAEKAEAKTKKPKAAKKPGKVKGAAKSAKKK